MAKRQRLKVFRTPIGFHDAYVAAPSQKAALEAWGAGTNLFAAGAAELVTDEELSREPLANPGAVIKRPRGGVHEHVAELRRSKEHRPDKKSNRRKPRVSRPSRASLDKAEQALDHANRRQEAELNELKKDEEDLAKRKRELKTKHRKERDRLERTIENEGELHRQAVAKWQESL